MANEGRPCEFTQEKADQMCAMLSEGKSLRAVCATDGMPSAPTFFRWLRTYDSFLKQYEKAKQEAADALVEEMLDIADDGTNDWMETHDKEGASIGWKLNGEHVQRSRLRLDARKWIAAKLKPKKYGDKITHEGDPDKPITHEHSVKSKILQSIPQEELDRIMREAEGGV